jgi:hypothetical protein
MHILVSFLLIMSNIKIAVKRKQVISSLKKFLLICQLTIVTLWMQEMH